MPEAAANANSHHWRVSPCEQLPGPWYLNIVDKADADLFSSSWSLFHTGAHSLLYKADGSTCGMAKLIKPRSMPRDQLRKYWHAQAYREYMGGLFLRRLGLITPRNLGWGVALSPFSRFDSALFMAPIKNFRSGLTVIRQEQKTQERQDFLERVASGVAAIYGNGHVHKDCHFDNICRLDDGRIVWIDNDVRKTRSHKALMQGFDKTIALLRKTAGQDLAPGEWRYFLQKMKDSSFRHPHGEMLRNEIQ